MHSTQFYQRPVPAGAQDIGTWMSIFQFLSVAAVVTNAALVCFTMDVLRAYSPLGRTWYVACLFVYSFIVVLWTI